MIKYLFIVINALTLFIFGLFSGDNGITVTSNIPASINAGEEIAIELKVNKGGMNGFAKLQLELPEGISVKESEDKGANYSYNAGIAKWVWAALPMESEIVIKLTIVASESSLGAKTIAAKYSYVENNIKQVVEMSPAEVNVVAPGTIVASTEIPKPLENQDSLAKITPSPAPVNTSSNSEPPGDVSVVRNLTAGSVENEFIIVLKIKKGATKGFARYSDDLPDGITARAVKTDGGSFSVADGKIKFVWVNVPEKEELEISYAISGSSSNAINLNGEYSYLEDNQSKKFKLTPESIAFQAPQITSLPKEEKTETVKDENVTNTSPENKVDPVTEKKEGNMNYLVQIGAFTNGNVSSKTLVKKFKINEKIKSEMQGGFSKFMVGSHAEYKIARNQRETIKNVNGVKSAFVVAYNEGKRITVQEALMITNQKWFK